MAFLLNPYRFAAAPTYLGYIYAIGGHNGSSYLSLNERYDIATNSWSTQTAITAAKFLGGTFLIGSLIYCVAGMNSSGAVIATNYEFNPAGGGSWVTKTSMTASRRQIGDTSIGTDKGYIVGGYSGSAYTANHFEFSNSSGSWATKNSMTAAKICEASTVGSDKYYATHGYNVIYTGSNYQYSQSSGSWLTLSSGATPRYGIGQATIGSDKLNAVGGYNGSYTDTHQEYSVSSNVWVTLAALPNSCNELRMGSVDSDKGYACGGGIAAGVSFDTNFRYSQSGGAWSVKATLSARHGLMVQGAI